MHAYMDIRIFQVHNYVQSNINYWTLRDRNTIHVRYVDLSIVDKSLSQEIQYPCTQFETLYKP